MVYLTYLWKHKELQRQDHKRLIVSYVNPFSAGTDFIRQNLTSVDVKVDRALKELK